MYKMSILNMIIKYNENNKIVFEVSTSVEIQNDLKYLLIFFTDILFFEVLHFRSSFAPDPFYVILGTCVVACGLLLRRVGSVYLHCTHMVNNVLHH